MIKFWIFGFLVLVFILLSGLFSGAETGVYQLSRLKLRIGIQNKKLPYILLGRCLRDAHGLLISILIGNNLANYLLTSMVTYILLQAMGSKHAVEFLTTLIAAPVLFIFAELIPKNLYFHKSEKLMVVSSPILYLFHKTTVCTGAVAVLRFISKTISRFTHRSEGAPLSGQMALQPHIKAIMHDTIEEGLLSITQTDIINRTVNISDITLNDVMTAINDVDSIKVTANRNDLYGKLKQSRHTRFPVYRDTITNIIGYINIYELLCRPDQINGLEDYVKPVKTLSAYTSVSEAIQIMQNESLKIILVSRPARLGYKRSIGIVTMKDLVEEFIGELTEW